jgi:hypothetical protein
MGMDVTGTKPRNEQGEYFRANIWSWHPLHELLGIINKRNNNELISEEVYVAMRYNDGAGLTDEQCLRVAEELNEIINKPALATEFGFVLGDNELRLPTNSLVIDEKTNAFVNMKTYKGSRDDLVSPYRINLDHLKEFITFLQNCGGFSVY